MNMNQSKFLPHTLGQWVTVVIGLFIITGSIGGVYFGLQTKAQATEDHTAMEKKSNEAHTAILNVINTNQKAQQSTTKRVAIDRLDEQITAIEYNLLYGNLTDDQKKFWDSKLDTLKTDKECVRSGQCN